MWEKSTVTLLSSTIRKGVKLMGYTTLRPTSITPKAHELAKTEAKRRENMGIPSSITAVISEAVIDKYGEGNVKK